MSVRLSPVHTIWGLDSRRERRPDPSAKSAGQALASRAIDRLLHVRTWRLGLGDRAVAASVDQLETRAASRVHPAGLLR